MREEVKTKEKEREHGARTSNYETPRKKSRGCTDVKYSESNHGSGMRGRKRVNALNKSSSHHAKTNNIHIWCNRKYIRLGHILENILKSWIYF